MANQFVSVSYDKFKNKTVTTMSKDLTLDEDYRYNYSIEVNLRHVSHPLSEFLLLDVKYTRDHWLFMRNGGLIININNVENIRLKAHENSTERVAGDMVYESCYYDMTQEMLKRICDAKSVDLRIYGKYSIDVENANKFIRYAQVFYNGCYDEEAYKEACEEAVRESSTGCITTLLLMFSALSSLAVCLFYVIFLF